MKKNNYIVSILNIIFFVVSILSRGIFENNNMTVLVKPTILSYSVEIIFILLIVFINVYAVIKNNLKEMKIILIINLLVNCINGIGMFLTGIQNSITSDELYLFFNIIIFVVLILSIVIIYINKEKINDSENDKNIIFKIVLILEILFSVIILAMFMNSIHFHEINKELNRLDQEKYIYTKTYNEKIEKFTEYEENGKYGIKDDKNKIIVNAEYEYVSKFIVQANLVYGYKDHSIDVYDDEGQKLRTYKDSIFFHYFKEYDSFSSKHSLLRK